MENKKITLQKYNNLLRVNEVMKQKGIKLIKSKLRFYIGISVFTISILTPFTNWFLIPISFAICGLSFFDIKNIYAIEIKRKIKNKIRGFRFRS